MGSSAESEECQAAPNYVGEIGIAAGWKELATCAHPRGSRERPINEKSNRQLAAAVVKPVYEYYSEVTYGGDYVRDRRTNAEASLIFLTLGLVAVGSCHE
jgi:hypothetical protein